MTMTLVRHFNVSIPPGTPTASPLVTLTQFLPATVERIEWLFPAGCAGLVGIQIGARAVVIIPHNTSQFITRTGDSAGVDLDGAHDTGDWSVIGYNTGTFPHTIHVTFHTHPLTAPDTSPFILDYVDPILGMGES